MTEWRRLDWLPDYEISEHGGVRRATPGPGTFPGKILGSRFDTNGRLQITVGPRAKRRSLLVHRLVCEAWHGPPPFNGAHAAHGDGNNVHNHYTNLRWATVKENCADRRLHGRSGRSLTEDKVREIRASLTGKRGDQSAAARKYGVHPQTISLIARNIAWPVGDGGESLLAFRPMPLTEGWG